jgi:hypothetical protein
VGFCGKKEEHKCQSHFSVLVGEGIPRYKIIIDTFKNCVIDHCACVISVKVLHAKLLRLVVVVHLK